MEQQQLCKAAKLGDVDEVRRLVARGMDPQATDLPGRAPIHYASEAAQLRVVQYLVEEAHVSVDLPNKLGATALHFACKTYSLLVVRYLVETAGANVEARTFRGHTPLHIASFCGIAVVIGYLVDQGQADVDAKDSHGFTALDIAVRRDRPDAIRFLLPRVSYADEETFLKLWESDSLVDIRGMALEKYASGRGLANAFRQNPIHTLFLEVPLPSSRSFEEAIALFPSSVLSLLDEEGRLAIHVAVSSRTERVKRSPSVVALLFEREPRSAVARDPTTGLYPHETVAGLVTDDNDGCSWLDVAFKMFRTNPQQILLSRHDDPEERRAMLSYQEELVG